MATLDSAPVGCTNADNRHTDQPSCDLCGSTPFTTRLGHSIMLIDTITCAPCENRLQRASRHFGGWLARIATGTLPVFSTLNSAYAYIGRSPSRG